MVSLQAKGETILKLSPTCSCLEQPNAEDVTSDAQVRQCRAYRGYRGPIILTAPWWMRRDASVQFHEARHLRI